REGSGLRLCGLIRAGPLAPPRLFRGLAIFITPRVGRMGHREEGDDGERPRMTVKASVVDRADDAEQLGVDDAEDGLREEAGDLLAHIADDEDADIERHLPRRARELAQLSGAEERAHAL